MVQLKKHMKKQQDLYDFLRPPWFVCHKQTKTKLFLKMFPSFDASRFLAEKQDQRGLIDANLMAPALSSCSEYQGIQFPLEPTEKWQHDATSMRFFFCKVLLECFVYTKHNSWLCMHPLHHDTAKFVE